MLTNLQKTNLIYLLIIVTINDLCLLFKYIYFKVVYYISQPRKPLIGINNLGKRLESFNFTKEVKYI